MKNYRNDNIYIWNPRTALLRLLYSAGYVLTIAALLYSCDNFVDVDFPKNQLDSDRVFEEKGTANAAMTDIYSKIRDNGLLTGSPQGISMALGLYTDELDYYGSSVNGLQAFFNNTLIAPNIDVATYWNDSYNQIYAANMVIEGTERSVKLPQADKEQLKGEALFVRAFVHTYLAGVFGNVPYVKATDPEVTLHVSRLPVTEVYNQAMADLNQAIVLLPENYVDDQRVRPNRYAAHALLARVALYAGQWDIASNEASAVLNNTELYPYVNDPDLIFKKESTSTVWQLAPNDAGRNSLQGSAFIFTSKPPPLAALSPELMAAFEPGDLRKTKWTKAVSNATDTWYHAYKYQKRNNTGTTVEMSIVLRLGELYLIRAEARARAGELIGAKDDLNMIRATAGLPETTALTQDELLAAILHERQVELFTEYGHRFFDLKRFGVINPVLSAVKNGWDDYDILLPIPQAELNLNPNLNPQNPGY
jgi:tetratricopeptide (TPR) repeat protein